MNLDLGFDCVCITIMVLKKLEDSGQAYFKCQKDNSARYTLKLEVKLKNSERILVVSVSYGIQIVI